MSLADWCTRGRGNRALEAQSVKQQGQSAQAEAAIDQSPVQRDTTNRARNECEREDGEAGDESDQKRGPAGFGVKQRRNEKHRDDDVPEGEPIGAVSDPRVLRVSGLEAKTDGEDPKREAAVARRRGGIAQAENSREKAQFGKKRK